MNEKWFGSVYEGMGSTSKDLILKTKGQIKIQIGKKFIDLLDKNGKIVSESNGIFKEISTLNEIVSDGIYILEGNVYIKSNDNLIQLGGGNGELTYLSYISQQNVTPEQKNIAKKNLGLQFDTLQEAISAVDTGLVFIGDKIYYISGTNYSEFKGGFSNPLKDQLVIQKNNSKNGSLLIKGNSFQNGITFNDSSHIYEENKKLNIDNEIGINLLINNSTILELSSYTANFKIPIITNSIKSNEFREGQSGFILKSVNGHSTLEVDNIVERNKQDQSILFEPIQYSKSYLITEANIIYEEILGIKYLSKLTLKIHPEQENLNSNDIFLINYSGEVMLISDDPNTEETNTIISTDTTNYIFELMYNVESNDNCNFIFVTWDNSQEKYIPASYEIVNINENNYITIDTNKYLRIDDLNLKLVNRHLFVKAEQSNSNKFKIDYNAASISIEENIPSDLVSGVVKSDTHVLLGNVLEYTTESTRRSEQGLFSDQSVLNGAEFRGPIKKEIVTRNTSDFTQEELSAFSQQGIDVSGSTIDIPEYVYRIYDFPRYSSELETELENQGSNANNNIIPSVKWIKDYVGSNSQSSSSDIVICTQQEYNLLENISQDTFYLITEEVQ